MDSAVPSLMATPLAAVGLEAQRSTPVLSLSSPVFSNNVQNGVICIAMDITEKKKAENMRREFTANVSHELKTPLTSMKVLADSINSMPDAPKELYQEFMEDITNEIERETKIINDLLSLVKMDKSAAGLNVSSVNINELFELLWVNSTAF